ncbi:hypothetical protein [Pseudonocardia oroxyli]|uniref:GAF domain-containing protein n=1 Tax=Pseudonocardia oroxyli TaxID=366584 RepID=A0A1G8BNR0_PSEOR|nr:hypothetical protein [Pseudonocardia oroxyli]SDH34811.1 hypothetical protein SAMN05216377_12181 [Pseudonocardia oroxyli]
MSDEQQVSAVRRLDTPESGELAQLSAVFEDLQYVLRCCENLVNALAVPRPDPVLVEALWTGAVVGYVRCFSGRTKILTDTDVEGLELEDEVKAFHKNFSTLRDHYASRHVNPREAFTIGIAQANDGHPTGVAIVSTPRPGVDDTTVRVLGRISYALSGLIDGRMQESQARVLEAARSMTPAQLAELPIVHLSEEPVGH